MKNKGSVLIGIFALIVFLLVCHGCYLKMCDTVEEYDASMEAMKKTKDKTKAQSSLKQVNK